MSARFDRTWPGAIAAALLSLPLMAQAEGVTRWESVARTETPGCADGMIAAIEERPGELHMKLRFANGRAYAEFDMKVAADGSGRTQFTTAPKGVVVDLEVMPGAGKRPMKGSASTNCLFLWTPK